MDSRVDERRERGDEEEEMKRREEEKKKRRKSETRIGIGGAVTPPRRSRERTLIGRPAATEK